MDTHTFTGHLILIMAPSGSGKSQLVKHIKREFPDIVFALTHTTRKQRPGEAAGSSYRFIEEQTFHEAIAEGAFIEWAKYSGNYYGTPQSEILGPLQNGTVVLKEMELQGVMRLKEIIPPENMTVIYIEAGEWEQLRERIINRAPISAEDVALRHQRYLEEIKMKPYTDVVIDNMDGKLQDAKQKFAEMVQDIFKKVA